MIGVLGYNGFHQNRTFLVAVEPVAVVGDPCRFPASICDAWKD